MLGYNRTAEVTLQKDIFGRMLGIRVADARRKNDEDKALTTKKSYPLSPVPSSLCHLNGSIRNIAKSKLVKCLDVSKESHSPNIPAETLVIDSFLFSTLIGKFTNKIRSFIKTFFRINH